MQRRLFLQSLIAGGLLAGPPLSWATTSRADAATLLLIELKGGNDGLNTVVPYADPAYYRLRPTLGLPRDKLLQLDEKLALHPALAPLHRLWKQQQLAIALGVGYPQPNLSHFRSIDIWNSGSGSERFLQDGWVARQLQLSGVEGKDEDAITVGIDPGPLAGREHPGLVIQRPERFFRQANQLHTPVAASDNPALAHLLATGNHVQQAARQLQQGLKPLPADSEFPPGRFGRQLALATRLLLSGVATPAIKISLGSFDTHTRQADQHARLLQQLADGLAEAARLLRARGRWNETLIMTYSEFGRRPRENGSGGTDHGTAAPHFLLGGRVKGGLYGRQPSLTRLDNGNLVHHLDYRRLYATLIARGWRSPGNIFKGFQTVSCIRA